MKNNMLRELQDYYYSLKDVNGHWRKNPVGFIYEAGTSEKNIETVKKILTIIMDSDYISIETKIFISSKGISIRGVNEFINDARAIKLTQSGKVMKALSYNSTCIKLREDNEALEAYLGDNTLRDIVYDRIENEKDTNRRLVKFKERFGENYNYRDNLGLIIKQTTPQVNNYMNNEDFFDILGSIEAYLVQRKEIMERAINANTDFVDYFNYLLSKDAIDNDLVQKDRERLIRFLKNEDYTTGYVDSGQTESEDKSFIDEIEQLRKIQPQDIEVKGDKLKMNNYTALNYDALRGKADTSEESEEDNIDFSIPVDSDIKVIM